MSNKLIYSLLIDTSSSRSIVSLNKFDYSLSHVNLNLEKDLSTSLFPSIQLLLEKNDLTAKDLSFVAVGTGPGAYTGIRVGAASAKSISYALDIPLIGFCSLKCFIPPHNGSFFSLLDAKSGGIYLIEGEKNQHTVIYKQKPTLIPFDKTSQHLTKNHYIVSPHMDLLKEKFDSLINPEKCYGAYPDPIHLAKISFFKYKNKNFTLSDKLQLLYLRGPKAIAL
jgi:tRNA threonylcarbamoyladenosine biosynthesis protein TsaB